MIRTAELNESSVATPLQGRQYFIRPVCRVVRSDNNVVNSDQPLIGDPFHQIRSLILDT